MLGCLAGCRYGFDPVGTETGDDARIEGDAFDAVDATPLGAFGAPTRVAELSTSTFDYAPFLMPDQLTIYFVSDRTAGTNGDLWWASRTMTSDPFGIPQRIAELSTGAAETAPVLSADGLQIYFSSNRPGGSGAVDIWGSTRPNLASTWSVPVPITELNSAENDYSSSLSPAGDRMYLTYHRSGVVELWSTKRAGVGTAWDPPQRDVLNPAQSASATNPETVVFSRNGDLFMAVRVGTGWGPAMQLTQLNSPGLDGNAWLSPDLRTMYFDSNRNSKYELFVARR